MDMNTSHPFKNQISVEAQTKGQYWPAATLDSPITMRCVLERFFPLLHHVLTKP